MMDYQPSTLTDLLEQRREEANQQRRVALGLMLDAVDRRPSVLSAMSF